MTKHRRRKFFKIALGGLLGGGAGYVASDAIRPANVPPQPDDGVRGAVAGAAIGAGIAAFAHGAPRGEFTPDTEDTPDNQRKRWQDRADREREDREDRQQEP